MHLLCYSSRDAKLDAKDEASVEDSLSSCKTQRFQSTIAEVYTRFVLSDVQPQSYLLHRKASFRVTNLIKHQLRAADTSIARLRDGNVVDGLKPGRTEIQVKHACLFISGYLIVDLVLLDRQLINNRTRFHFSTPTFKHQWLVDEISTSFKKG
jgi:Transmembrane protein family 132